MRVVDAEDRHAVVDPRMMTSHHLVDTRVVVEVQRTSVLILLRGFSAYAIVIGASTRTPVTHRWSGHWRGLDRSATSMPSARAFDEAVSHRRCARSRWMASCPPRAPIPAEEALGLGYIQGLFLPLRTSYLIGWIGTSGR